MLRQVSLTFYPSFYPLTCLKNLMFIWGYKRDFLSIFFVLFCSLSNVLLLSVWLRKRKVQPQREIEEVLDQMGRTLKEATQIDIPRKCKVQAQSEIEEALDQIIKMGRTMNEAT